MRVVYLLPLLSADVMRGAIWFNIKMKCSKYEYSDPDLPNMILTMILGDTTLAISGERNVEVWNIDNRFRKSFVVIGKTVVGVGIV